MGELGKSLWNCHEYCDNKVKKTGHEQKMKAKEVKDKEYQSTAACAVGWSVEYFFDQTKQVK